MNDTELELNAAADLCREHGMYEAERALRGAFKDTIVIDRQAPGPDLPDMTFVDDGHLGDLRILAQSLGLAYSPTFYGKRNDQGQFVVTVHWESIERVRTADVLRASAPCVGVVLPANASVDGRVLENRGTFSEPDWQDLGAGSDA